jgi:hypothetical protein
LARVWGICGLGLSWRAAGQVLAAPRPIGEWLIAVVIVAAAILPKAPSAALFLWALGTGGQLVLFLTLLGDGLLSLLKFCTPRRLGWFQSSVV